MSQQEGALASGSEGSGGTSDTLVSLILKGKPFSGDETDCVFMNTGGGRFADVSHAVGFNSPDDGRALLRTDWDQDGDLDFWMVNRNGPTLRFFRNNTPTMNRSVMLLLEGTSSNRDAIGARVEMTLAPDTEGALTRSVRAGDGFLAQSTRWLHFGLGAESEPAVVTVRWPSGSTEEFAGVTVAGRYRLVEGTGRAQPVASGPREIRLAEIPLGRQRTTDVVATITASRLPAPILRYVQNDGSIAEVGSVHRGPVLLNLWASWCLPCIGELTEFTQEEDRLRDAGVEVLALTLDSISGDDASDVEKAREILEKIGFPFTSGQATPETVRKLELAHGLMFQQPVALPVPTSFLIDENGRIAAVYRGPVSVEQVVADVATINEKDDIVRMASVPMPGRWLSRQSAIRVLPYVLDLMNAGFLDDALEYTDKNREPLSRDIAYQAMLTALANALTARGDYARAAEVMEAALLHSPSTPNLRVRTGIVYLQAGDTERAAGKFRDAIEHDDGVATAHFYLSRILGEQGMTDDALAHATAAVDAAPNSIQSRLNLARMLDSADREGEAMTHYRMVHEAEPGNTSVVKWMVWILATHPDDAVRDGEEAVSLALAAFEAIGDADLEIHAALAAAYAEAGRFDDAVSVLNNAIDIASENNLESLINTLSKHRDAFARGDLIRMR